MEKERHARRHWREDLLEKLAEDSKMEIPEILVAGEAQKAMEDFKERVPKMTGMDFAGYLKKIGKTEAQVQEDIAKDSETRIKRFLILQEIAKAEKIDVGEEEIAAAIAKSRGENGEDADDAANEEREKAYWRQELQTEKVFEFLEANSKK
jgi:FKBP-type peptidyl-prolyl cis-trans isomerase (trigger factor)